MIRFPIGSHLDPIWIPRDPTITPGTILRRVLDCPTEGFLAVFLLHGTHQVLHDGRGCRGRHFPIHRCPRDRALSALNWGGIALGAAVGIAVSLVANLVVGIVVAQPLVLSILIHLGATVFAGYVAGRFAPDGAAAVNGGIAGLLIFLFVGVISLLAATGPNPLELAILGLVAAVLGSAGGVLADRRRID